MREIAASELCQVLLLLLLQPSSVSLTHSHSRTVDLGQSLTCLGTGHGTTATLSSI